MALPLRASRRLRQNRLPLRFEQLETRDCPAVSVFGADQGGGPLVIVYDTQSSLTTPTHQFFAFDSKFRGGVRVATTDVSGDGVPDIIAAAGPGGGPHVRVFDGVSGNVIRSFFAFDPGFTGGTYVAGGDVDRDGVGDIIVAAGPGGGPHVRVFSGATGSVIHSFFAFNPKFGGGVRVGAGDVNNDGYTDIIAAAGPGGGPHVRVFDGKSGVGNNGFFAYPASFNGGVNVAAGDLNGDGSAEIITGPGLGGGPLVRVFSGTTGQRQLEFNAFLPGIVGAPNSDPNALWTSGLTVGVADFPGASPLDIVAGPGAGRSTRIRVFDGQLGKSLSETALFDPLFLGGVFVGGAKPTPISSQYPQATFIANPVNEGSSGTVSFVNPTGGSGGYQFSFDFDNNGTFDLSGNTSGNATVLANLLGNGPAARAVRGRITDSKGQFTDYIANIAIANVPPSVILNGSFAGQPGASINFAATVTDPSPADTAAGFTYLWDFGDGSTSTLKSPSHTFAAAGSYSLKLIVHDQDNGQTTSLASVAISSTAPPTALFVGGTANEGNNTDVTFTNASGGTGKYTYSFDFNNDGAFEVTDSTIGLSSVPSTYLADGPGTRTVRGRIKDSTGAFTDYTTTVNITNLPPAVQLAGPFVGLPNSAISFSATVTDPSPTDNAAGFTYSWNFGDGGTSNLKSPSHIYGAAGTYTVTLSATDKDNGVTTKTGTVIVGAVTTSFINTPNDRIPNFGANPTVTATATGNWSNPSIWSTGKLPAAGDVVSIGLGVVVTYDVFSDVAVKTVAIQAGGSLRFRTDISTRLTVANLLVMEAGELQIGTAANPVTTGVKAEVIFADVAMDLAADPAQFGNGLIALGKVTMHGSVLSDTFIRLAAEPLAGATTLSLTQPVTGWKTGDRVVLPDSRQLLDGENFGNYVPKWETATISKVSTDGLTITLTQPIQYDHKGAKNPDGLLEFLPHVGNLSRNISLRSQSNFGTRGHTYFTHHAEVDIRFAAFQGLGRTLNDADDNTTFDASNQVTHVGTNQTARYPVNFRHLLGPTGGTTSGSQFVFLGNAVTCLMNPQPFRWGVSVHNSHYGLIQDNVVYNWAGAGIAVETPSTSFNHFNHNFVVGVRGDENPRDNTGRDGSGFWTRGFNNYFLNNVATSTVAYFQGIVAGSGFNLGVQAAYHSNTRIPLFPGADLTITGQYQLTDAQLQPILQFQGNEAYGAAATGLTLWHLGTDGYISRATQQTVIQDFTAWHVWEEGFFGYPVQNVLFDGFVVRGNNASNSIAGGWSSGDYWAGNVTIRNANIQGLNYGVGSSFNTPGEFRIENSYMRNYRRNVVVSTLATPGARATKPPRTTYVDNVQFVPFPGAPSFEAITMSYNDTMAGSNFIQRDEVIVHNFNNVVGDNFQVYYYQQDPNYIVPQTTYYGPDNNNDGIPDWVDSQGSPVAGLTNAQNWATYGIAIAGCIAPTVNTRSSIHGYVRSF